MLFTSFLPFMSFFSRTSVLNSLDMAVKWLLFFMPATGQWAEPSKGELPSKPVCRDSQRQKAQIRSLSFVFCCWRFLGRRLFFGHFSFFSHSPPQNNQFLAFAVIAVLSDCQNESSVWVAVLLESSGVTGVNHTFNLLGLLFAEKGAALSSPSRYGLGAEELLLRQREGSGDGTKDDLR